MVRNYTRSAYIERLRQHVLVFDGAMGTNLQAQNLTVTHYGGERTYGCNDYLVISYPQAVEQIHRAFLEAGVDVIETNTFRSNRITLAEYGLQSRVVEINRAAASLARRLADEFSTPEHPRFVAGAMGPSGKLPSAEDAELSDITFDELADVFMEQAVGLIEGGVDLLLIETSQDILEVKSAIIGIHKAFEATNQVLPIQAQVTLDTRGRMLLGTDVAAALTIIQGMGVEVVGLNCSTGPEHMREPIAYLVEHARLPVACIPNAGLPLNVDGQAVYPLAPQTFAEEMAEFVHRFGVRVVGGCCGTTAAHLKMLVELLRKKPRSSSKGQKRIEHEGAFLASATRAFAMRQEPPPLLIGERCNAQGSRAFKRYLLAEDYDAMIALARQQVEGGAHALDISVAVTERSDEVELMRRLVKRISNAVEVPLVIDTTEPEVMEAALKVYPGRCLLNSTHLEGGRARAERVFSLAKRFNAAVLVLTIDEQGMAKTASRKVEVACRIHEIAVNEFGLRPQDLVFDPLTFTLATGEEAFRDSAVHTLEAIRQIKARLPGVFTSLGVSNVSFGLSPAIRPVLNSVMLYHALRAGLDMAIVNTAHITPYADIPQEQRTLCEDLIFNRSPDALERLIAYFEGMKPASNQTGRPLSRAEESKTPRERLYWRIVHRHKEGVEADIDAILADAPADGRHAHAVELLNTVLLPAMKEVGDRFGAGELILPFVLQSAEVMKAAVAYLEGFLERREGVSKGKVVLATVYGDVHDIGKNLVKTILANNGFTIIDLGKQVPAETIISTAVETEADAIGLSALLVSTSKQMPLIVNELKRRQLNFPVLIGGAAINRRFGWRVLQTEDGEFYAPGVFYCKDAFEGLAVMEALGDEAKRQELLDKIRREAERELNRPLVSNAPGAQKAVSNVPPAKRIPVPPAWGARVVQNFPLEAVFQYLPKNELFRLSWGAKNAHGEEWDRLQAEFEARLQRMQQEAMREGWLKPQGVYGYWPAQSEGNELIVYDAEIWQQRGTHHEVMRFSFPRQPDGEHLCLADYFASVETGVMDVVAFQVVTVGHVATERFDTLQGQSAYAEAYYFHGLAVQTAEAAAEYLHRHIRRELGMPLDQGKRYSWGYPAIPDLEGHALVFRLLPAEEALQMSLTASYQLVPEQSTAAIVVHHPLAKYFNIGESRLEQLLK